MLYSNQECCSSVNIQRVQTAFQADPQLSIRRAANGLIINRETVRRILKEEMRWQPYKLQILHQLIPSDHALRLDFA